MEQRDNEIREVQLKKGNSLVTKQDGAITISTAVHLYGTAVAVKILKGDIFGGVV